MKTGSFKILLFILIIPFVSFRCVPPQEERTSLEEYYGIVNEAENRIVENKPEEALKLYESAFLIAKGRSYARDIYNAAVCASRADNSEAVFMFSVQLVQRGVHPQEVLSNRTLSKSLPAAKLKELEKALNKGYSEFERNKEVHLLNSIDSLVRVDQYFREMQDPYKNFGDTIRKTDLRNAGYVKELLTQTNYPLESAIGTTFPDKSVAGYVVMRHAYQQGDFSLDATLKEAVLQLKVSPQLYGTLNELQNPKVPYGTNIYKVGEAYYGKTYTSEEEKLINAKRKEVGLDDLENYRSKFRYAMQHPEYKFDFDNGIIDMSAIIKPNDERLADFKKIYPVNSNSSSSTVEDKAVDKKTLAALQLLTDAANRTVNGSTQYQVSLEKDSVTGTPYIHFSAFIADMKPLDEGGDFRSRYHHFVDFKGEKKALLRRILVPINGIRLIEVQIYDGETFYVFHSMEDKPFMAVPKKNPKEATTLPLEYQPIEYEAHIPVPKGYDEAQIQYLLDKFSPR